MRPKDPHRRRLTGDSTRRHEEPIQIGYEKPSSRTCDREDMSQETVAVALCGKHIDEAFAADHVNTVTHMIELPIA